MSAKSNSVGVSNLMWHATCRTPAAQLARLRDLTDRECQRLLNADDTTPEAREAINSRLKIAKATGRLRGACVLIALLSLSAATSAAEPRQRPDQNTTMRNATPSSPGIVATALNQSGKACITGKGVTVAPDFERYADAVRRTEGVWTYGIKTIVVTNEAHARRICLNTLRNNYTRWQKAGQPGCYINFTADRYCPPSADPVGNRNWKRNMHSILAAKCK